MSPRLSRALVVAACLVLLGSTVAIAASLTVSTARLATFIRIYGAPATCTLEPVADAHVREDTPLTNYGAELAGEVQSGANAARRFLVRFDLAACSPAIPTDAMVHSATLRLTLAAEAVDARAYQVHRLTGPWSEATVDWSSQPGAGASPASSLDVSAGTPASTVLEWSVAANVQAFVTGTSNDGWRISDSAEATTSSGIQLHAREAASSRPQLVITYGG